MKLFQHTIVVLMLLTTASCRVLNNKTCCLSQPTYICAVRPTLGNVVRGTVMFTTVFREQRRRRRCLVRIRAKITNLTPGFHGFHVHTYGDGTSDTGSSAGGHFSNTRGYDLPHGYPNDRRRHWGDFGNLTATGDGMARYDRVDRVVRYRTLLGRSVIVHELRDQGSIAQPSGASGARQASCVIGFANPETLESLTF